MTRIRERRTAVRDGSDAESSDISVRGEVGSLDDRRISNEEWDERVGAINAHGLAVRLVLDPLPEDPEVYEPEAQEWVEDDNADHGGYWRNKAVLLSIRLVPLHDVFNGFPRLTNRSRRHGEAPYHISLCFTNELHRFDLFDRHRGVEMGKGVYRALQDRYDGRVALLRGRVQGASFELNGRTHVHRSDHHNIVRDYDVWALHDCGQYHGRKLHVSL